MYPPAPRVIAGCTGACGELPQAGKPRCGDMTPLVSVEPGLPFTPQQSVSLWQSSPVGWQPLGGSQMSAPVGA